MKSLEKIFFSIKDKKFQIVVLFILTILMSILEITGIGLVGGYIGFIASSDFSGISQIKKILSIFGEFNDRQTTINFLGILILSILFFRFILKVLSNFFILKITAIAKSDLLIKLTKIFLQMSYLDYSKRDSAEFYNSVTNYCDQFSNSLIASLKLFNSIIFLLGIVIFLVIVDLYSFLILSSLIILLLALNKFFFSKEFRSLGLNLNFNVEKIFKNLKEGLTGLKEIRILNKTGYFFNIIKKSSLGIANNSIKYNTINDSFRDLIEFALGAIIIFLVIFITNFHSSEYSLSIITIFGIAGIRSLPLISNSITSLNTMTYSQNAINTIYNYLNMKASSEKMDTSEKIYNVDSFNTLDLEGISFSYSKNLSILSKVNLKVVKGDIIGIVGDSGSGKTTLVDIITGLLEANDGFIKYNGKKLNYEEIIMLRNKIAYLPQQSFIFNDTIKNNIAFNIDDKKINVNKIHESIKAAGISDFINNLPEKLNYILGEHGGKISGGQKQRISLARAFYNEKEIMILDEFTSSLDEVKENEIMETIKKLSASKTFIIVSHKKSTLKFCNKIFEIKSGRLEKLN